LVPRQVKAGRLGKASSQAGKAGHKGRKSKARRLGFAG
jgi:hypothetical protein